MKEAQKLLREMLGNLSDDVGKDKPSNNETTAEIEVEYQDETNSTCSECTTPTSTRTTKEYVFSKKKSKGLAYQPPPYSILGEYLECTKIHFKLNKDNPSKGQ